MPRNLNDFFDKVYVLTIERNFDRHPNVRSVLAGIDFEFWYGFDAKENFPDYKYVSDIKDEFFIKNDIDKEFAAGSTIGQFGAYLSIKQMIDHIAESGYENVLIFEDDMLPVQNDWRKIFKKSLEELPEDWDILLAGYVYDGPLYKYSYNRKLRFIVETFNAFKSLWKNENVIQKLPAKFSAHLDVSGYSMGGHAYCISKKGARLLSSYLSPMRDSGDYLMSRLIVERKINAFSVYPCLFIQDKKFGSKTNIL